MSNKRKKLSLDLFLEIDDLLDLAMDAKTKIIVALKPSFDDYESALLRFEEASGLS